MVTEKAKGAEGICEFFKLEQYTLSYSTSQKANSKGNVTKKDKVM